MVTLGKEAERISNGHIMLICETVNTKQEKVSVSFVRSYTKDVTEILWNKEVLD